ncbi:hypothetical protein IGI04_030034 [Brassica rapa subsp. trilocularis]|uniref:Uncharacterized protein n=1 Tax=Brassica rapa subsp. trilocularis TaxID=1813537 RepID=A0ABQ7LPJ4_BRACM|nr:hypothetical protein IGI04_030034 [Brassica rapa subsp. trilocularis]
MAVTARSDYSGASRQSVTPVIFEHSRDLIMNPDEERFSRMSAHPMKKKKKKREKIMGLKKKTDGSRINPHPWRGRKQE